MEDDGLPGDPAPVESHQNSAVVEVDDIATEGRFLDSVRLPQPEVSRKFREHIARRLRVMHEGRCGPHGFLLPGSISLHRVSVGRAEQESFACYTVYDVEFDAVACSPAPGCIVWCTARSVTRIGVEARCEVRGAEVLQVLVPLDNPEFPSDVDLAGVAPGDKMLVEMLLVRMTHGDELISVIARALDPGASPMRRLSHGRPNAVRSGPEMRLTPSREGSASPTRGGGGGGDTDNTSESTSDTTESSASESSSSEESSSTDDDTSSTTSESDSDS
jgi:hypothetical protein